MTPFQEHGRAALPRSRSSVDAAAQQHRDGFKARARGWEAVEASHEPGRNGFHSFPDFTLRPERPFQGRGETRPYQFMASAYGLLAVGASQKCATVLLAALVLAESFSSVQAADPAPQAPPKPLFSVSATNLFADRILAKGKGVEVRQSQVDDLYVAFKATQAAAGKLVPDAMRKKIEADILDKLVTTQLVLSRATEADRTKAKGLVEELVAAQKKQAPSEESFNRQLLAVGMTPEQYRAQMLEQAIVESVIDREIRAKKVVTESQAREFYDKSPELFQEPELARVSHILFSTQDPKTGQDLPADQKLDKRRLAEKILDRAKKGDDFATLVKEFSEDTPSKDRGGEYTIARARDDRSRSVVPEFEAAAFSLAPNQTSDLVTTRYGYHIIKALERIPTRTMEFSRVVERIKQGLLKQEVEKDLPAYVEKLKKAADVQVVDGK